MNPDVLLFIALVSGVLAVVIALVVVQAKKTRANLAALGDKLRLSLVTQGGFLKKHRLTGEMRGKPVEIFSYTTGAGKSQRTWAAIAVRVRASGGLTFSLKRRLVWLRFLPVLFRKNTVRTGDGVFDEKWALGTNQPDFMGTALLPEIREKILRLSGSGVKSAHYKYERYTVQYAEQGSFSSVDLCDRFAQLADLVCDLADIVEVGAELPR